jgi:hypothetical protein
MTNTAAGTDSTGSGARVTVDVDAHQVFERHALELLGRRLAEGLAARHEQHDGQQDSARQTAGGRDG